jgi:GntR family transcriptional regulator
MEKRLEKSSYTPLSRQLFDILNDFILKGKYSSGQPFLTEIEISEKYGVSRTTVREATSRLVYEGLLRRERGKGTFVITPRIHEETGMLVPYSEEIEKRGLNPSSKFIELVLKEPTWKIRNILQLIKTEKVISLTRVRLADGEPMAFQTSYLPYSLCGSVYQGGYDWNVQPLTPILDELGFKIVRASQRIYSSTANSNQAPLLAIQEGSPLLCIERISFTQKDTPIEYVDIFNRGDRWDIIMELTRNKSEI